MRIVVDAVRCSDFALEPLIEGKSAVERVVEYVGRMVPSSPVTVLAGRGDLPLPSDWEVVLRDTWDAAMVIEALTAISGTEDDVFVWIAADTPFLDHELSIRMLQSHDQYFADVSFADGYPEGVAPLLISRRVLPTIAKLQERHVLPLERTFLLDVIQKDINAFDVETELSPTDMRYLRLRLAADSTEGAELCGRFARFSPRTVGDVVGIAEDHGEIMRTVPAYIVVQALEQEVQALSYSPYPAIRPTLLEPGRVMAVDDFASLIRRFAEINPSGTVGLSLWGELSLHPDPVALVDAVGDAGLRLVCETSGVGWRQEALEELASTPRDFLSWIVGLDAVDPDIYTAVRGKGFEEAQRFLEWALAGYPEKTYVQAVRTTETEAHLETFYKSLKQRTDHVIIQKYDHFCGRLPDRKVTDISPVIRRPCWHVKRDLVVLVDGTVPLCREDTEVNHGLGNAFEDDLAAVWRNGETVYDRHLAEDYPSLCGRCDEYYTYNF